MIYIGAGEAKKKGGIYLSRTARKYSNTSFFHVIVQGLNKEYIFNEKQNINEYLNLIDKYKKDVDIEFLSYCMMSNHAHFLIFSENINNLSSVMKNINTAYAKYYNHKNDRVGYVFRDRFLSQPIDSEKYLIKCINYIHNNPVKANIVKRPEEYKYSTYKEFINGERIKQLHKVTGRSFDVELFKNEKVLEYFIDIDTDKNEIIENAILAFCIKNNIEIYKILEVRSVLKKLIIQLKNDYKIKYTEIMKKLDIPQGVMKLLK